MRRYLFLLALLASCRPWVRTIAVGGWMSLLVGVIVAFANHNPGLGVVFGTGAVAVGATIWHNWDYLS